jgi:hypothetical protein
MDRPAAVRAHGDEQARREFSELERVLLFAYAVSFCLLMPLLLHEIFDQLLQDVAAGVTRVPG